MKIPSRLLIFVSILGATVFLSIFFLSSVVFNGSFKQIETDLTIQTANMLMHDIIESIDFLDNSAKDWAKWDDTYNFINGSANDYLTENFGPSTFKNLKINGIFILNDSQNLYYTQLYDYRTSSQIYLSSAGYMSLLQKISEMRQNNISKGIISVDNKLLLIAVQSITNSDETIETPGALVFLKYLYDDELKEVSEHIGEEFVVSMTEKTVMQEYPQATKIADNIYKRDVDAKHLDCLIQITDVLGKPVAIAHMDIKRNIYADYKSNMRDYLVAFFILTLFLTWIFFITVKEYVIDKITQVDEDISYNIAHNDVSKQLTVVADEEIVNLTNNFNKLSSLLQNNKDELLNKNLALEKANVALTKLDELKDSFLSNVSHEIRTPLTSLKSYTQLMLSGAFGKINSKQRETLHILIQSIAQLENLVTDILDVARYESGRITTHYDKNNLRRIISETLKEFNPTINKIHAKIIIHSKPIMWVCDKDKIKQLLRNLISNSIKYRGDKKLVIEIHAYVKSGKLCIIVKDNGMGMSKENLDHLFEKFYQVDQSMRRKVSGTGLGLTIVKQIVKLHKGEIHVESETGKGTIVRMCLGKHPKK